MNKIITTIFLLTAWTGLFAQRTTLPNPAIQTPSALNIKNQNGYQLQGRLVVNDSCWLNGNQVVIPNGNVGIGITTPSEKLHVNGNIRIDMPNGRVYTDSNEFVIGNYGIDSVFISNFTVDGNAAIIGADIYDTTTGVNFSIKASATTGAYAYTAGQNFDAGCGSPAEGIAEMYAGKHDTDYVQLHLHAGDSSIAMHWANPSGGFYEDSIRAYGGVIRHISSSTVTSHYFDKILTLINGTSAGRIVLLEAPANGTNIISIQSPSSITSNVGLTLPSALPTQDNQALISTTGGVLSFGSVMDAGTATLTSAALSNCTVSGSSSARYIRIGNVVTVSGSLVVTATADATSTSFSLTLPVASAFTTALQGSGTLSCQTAISNTPIPSGYLYSDGATDKIIGTYVTATGDGGASLNVYYTFTYQIL